MWQLKHSNSIGLKLQRYSQHSNALFIALAVALMMLTAALSLDDMSTSLTIMLSDLLDHEPVAHYGLLLIGSSVTCCWSVFSALMAHRSALNGCALLYVLSSTSYIILLLSFPEAIHQPTSYDYLWLFFIFRLWAIIGICATPNHIPIASETRAFNILHGLLASVVLLSLLSSNFRFFLAENIYNTLYLFIFLTIGINLFFNTRSADTSIPKLKVLTSVTHLIVIYVLDTLLGFGDIDSLSSTILISSTAIVWLDMLILFFVGWTVIITQQQQIARQRIKSAQQQQKLDDITGIITRSRHELRAPLSDIIGLTELVADSPLDNRQRSFLIEIQQSARKGLNDINRLFSFYPGKPRAADTETLSFDIESILQESIQYYSIYLEAKHGEVVTDISQLNSTDFTGQPEIIRQLLINVLEVLLVQCAANQLLVKLSSNENAHLVIEFDYHLTTSEQLSFQLNPFQLETANELVNELNGNLIHNTTEHTLITAIPLVANQAVNNTPVDTHWLKGKRALVIDDNATCCNVMTAYLQQMGINTYSDTKPVNAIARLHHQSGLNEAIDVILVDYLMPESNGLEVIQHIFADSQIKPKPRCILMSNTLPEYSKETLRNIGIDSVLEKPVLANTLRRTLLQLVDKNQGSARQTKALIIEDNDISAKIIYSQLENLGLECATSSTATNALEYLSQHVVDIIFMDYNLPDMESSQLIPSILTVINRPANTGQSGATTLVAMSADDAPQIIKACEALGAHTFVEKPLDADKINDVIQLHLRRQRQ